MNKDEVIALAEKCKLAVLIHSQWTAEIKQFTVVDYVVEGDLGSLMQFAALVASAERDRIYAEQLELPEPRLTGKFSIAAGKFKCTGCTGTWTNREDAKHHSCREWVGLTDEDISEIVRGTHNTGSFVRAIEAKLKEKNS